MMSKVFCWRSVRGCAFTVFAPGLDFGGSLRILTGSSTTNEQAGLDERADSNMTCPWHRLLARRCATKRAPAPCGCVQGADHPKWWDRADEEG